RQRVLIATAFVSQPRLIIADEPTSALDVTVQRQILDRLQRLTASQGTALLLITHDLAVAAERTDIAIALRQGQIVDSGVSRTLLTAPDQPYTRALVEAIPGRSGALATIRPPEPVADEPPLIEVRGAAKTYGHRRPPVQALLPIDLSVRTAGSIGTAGAPGGPDRARPLAPASFWGWPIPTKGRCTSADDRSRAAIGRADE